jgi:hypothetical protein
MKFIYLMLFISATDLVFAQSTSTQMGARSFGMGNASSVIADEWSLFNNIGGIGKINQANAGFAYEIRPALTGANRLAATITAPTKIASLGLGVFRFGDDLYNEHIVSLGVGNTIGNTSLGTKLNYIQYRAESFGTTTASSIDVGGITQLTPQISLGAYITNITRSKLNRVDGERLPTKMVAGLAFKPSQEILIATEIEKDLDYQVTWKTGMEYTVYKKFFIRTGFNLNPNAAFFGLGGQRKKLKFDYAVRLSQLVGIAHQMSAIYFLSAPIKK